MFEVKKICEQWHILVQNLNYIGTLLKGSQWENLHNRGLNFAAFRTDFVHSASLSCVGIFFRLFSIQYSSYLPIVFPRKFLYQNQTKLILTSLLSLSQVMLPKFAQVYVGYGCTAGQKLVGITLGIDRLLTLPKLADPIFMTFYCQNCQPDPNRPKPDLTKI